MTDQESAPRLAAAAIGARQCPRLDSAHPCRGSWGQCAPNDSECVVSSPRSTAPLLSIATLCIVAGGSDAPLLSIATLYIVAGGDHGGPALYPTPRTVNTTVGFSGSFSTLARSRWTCTFTRRVSAG